MLRVLSALFVDMRLLTFVSLACLGLSAVAQSSTVDTFIASESPIARTGLLANIGADGSKASGAKVRDLRGA